FCSLCLGQPYQRGLTAILCTIGSDSITKSVIHKLTVLLAQQYFINFIHAWQHRDRSIVYIPFLSSFLCTGVHSPRLSFAIHSPFLIA
ncbi:unnamed protein product, partial [Porites evermanni]